MKFAKELLEISHKLNLLELVREYRLMGSAEFSEDPKDLDILVLINHDAENNDDVLSYRGEFGNEFTLPPGEYEDVDGSRWMALRAGNINLIVTTDLDFYNKSVTSNEVVASLKLENKDDRIAVYQIIRDGYDRDDVESNRLKRKAR